MEIWLAPLLGAAATALDIIVVLIVLAGAVRALSQLGSAILRGHLRTTTARAIWVGYATAILLALEFALGADIIETAVAPTWSDIGQLGAIAAIRTGLGYFLGRDIAEFRATSGHVIEIPER